MSDLVQMLNEVSDEKVIEIMESLGSDTYKKTNNALIFKTICHHADSADASMKLYYYPKTKTFHCYTDCGCTFNLIEMFKKRYEILDMPYDFYRDIVLKIGSPSKQKETNSFYQPYTSLYENEENNNNILLKKINSGILNAFVFYPTIEWLSDGISVEAMKRYNILYSIEENKIIIPHYDIDGNLIGIRCRPLNDEELMIGKYLPIKVEGTTYSHPLGANLYGLNLVKDNIKKYKMAIVAEGEKSPLQYSTMFGQDRNIVVAACGNNFHKFQLDLLLKCGAERILIAFDKEGITTQEQEKYFNRLKMMCNRFSKYCSMGFIYDTKGLLKNKESPFDKGQKILGELIKRSVWI